jgi:digeranylgeranylglycerophospholipid reductase
MADEYTGDMVALNATVEGDFSDYASYPRIFFEGYVGYSWSFPKSDHHANIGIGWAGEKRPDDYMAALEAAAERNGFPVPHRDDVNIYTIPRGPSLDPENAHIPEDNVFLVGDAAGIANRYQGEGICQGIRSAYLLGDLIADDREAAYPTRLFESMQSEYRLAHLMRGAWVEHEDPELLARVAEALDGLTIDDITRQPRRVITRLLKHPRTAAQLVADRGMITRLLDAYTDSWEYSTAQPA